MIPAAARRLLPLKEGDVIVTALATTKSRPWLVLRADPEKDEVALQALSTCNTFPGVMRIGDRGGKACYVALWIVTSDYRTAAGAVRDPLPVPPEDLAAVRRNLARFLRLTPET